MTKSAVPTDPTPGGRRSPPPIVGVTLALASFLPVLVIVSLSPAMPSMIAHFPTLAHATTLVPLLITLPGLLVALLAPVAGVVVDRVGRRTPLLLATFCYALAGMAPLLLDGFVAIAITRVAVGACEAFVLVSINALLADYYDPDQRRFWLTVQGVVNPALGAVMTVVAGALTGWIWNGAFAAYAIVVPVFLSILLFCYEPERGLAPSPAPSSAPTAMPMSAPFPWRPVLVICAATLFASVMFYVYMVQAGLAFAAIGVTSSTAIGTHIALSAIGIPVGAVLFNLFSRKFPAEGLVAICLAFMGGGLVVIGLSRTPAMALMGGMVQQISAGMFISSFVFWVSHVLPPQHRGRGFGLWSSASFAGQFLSPVVVGLVRGNRGDILTTFLVLGLVTLLGALCLLMLARTPLEPQTDALTPVPAA